jgi:hypothetical protein
MAEIVVIPQALRSKLGDDGTRELVTRGAKEGAVEPMVERFERRLAETKNEVVRWMFVFWVGQIAVMIGLLSFFYNLLK